MCTHVLMRMHLACMHIRTRMQGILCIHTTKTHTCMHTYTQVHVHTHTRTHMCARTRTRAHTHTHTHTQFPSVSWVQWQSNAGVYFASWWEPCLAHGWRVGPARYSLRADGVDLPLWWHPGGRVFAFIIPMLEPGQKCPIAWNRESRSSSLHDDR